MLKKSIVLFASATVLLTSLSAHAANIKSKRLSFGLSEIGSLELVVCWLETTSKKTFSDLYPVIEDYSGYCNGSQDSEINTKITFQQHSDKPTTFAFHALIPRVKGLPLQPCTIRGEIKKQMTEGSGAITSSDSAPEGDILKWQYYKFPVVNITYECGLTGEDKGKGPTQLLSEFRVYVDS